jgi:hypothetical protein
MKRKVGEERGGGGGSATSDLGAKTRKKRKIKREKERKRAMLLRLDHFWSRSPSHGGEERPRSPEQERKRVRWARVFYAGEKEKFLDRQGLIYHT